MTHVLDVNNISCHYPALPSSGKAEQHQVVKALSFSLNEGEIGCLLGSSGCGKTTALRAIAGFHKITTGNITVKGKVLSNATVHIKPEQRNIGMVFQDYALFPHLNVAQNIMFGLGKHSKQEKQRICEKMLALVKMEGLGQRLTHELSGGQQQRIALARALAPSPQLLLLDEPFSSLDTELRRKLALEVRSILKNTNTSAIMVTHDQQEAFAFADKVGVMHQGCLEQWDIPFNLYHKPSTRYVANFIGQGVMIPGFVRGKNIIETALGLLTGKTYKTWPENTAVEVLLRPDDIIENKHSAITGDIVNKVFVGTSIVYHLKLATGTTIEAALPSHHNFSVGQRLQVSVETDHLIAFTRQ